MNECDLPSAACDRGQAAALESPSIAMLCPEIGLVLPEGRKSINGNVVRVGEAFDRLDAEGVRSHVVQTAPTAVGPLLQDTVDMVVLDSAEGNRVDANVGASELEGEGLAETGAVRLRGDEVNHPANWSAARAAAHGAHSGTSTSPSKPDRCWAVTTASNTSQMPPSAG